MPRRQHGFTLVEIAIVLVVDRPAARRDPQGPGPRQRRPGPQPRGHERRGPGRLLRVHGPLPADPRRHDRRCRILGHRRRHHHRGRRRERNHRPLRLAGGVGGVGAPDPGRTPAGQLRRRGDERDALPRRRRWRRRTPSTAGCCSDRPATTRRPPGPPPPTQSVRLGLVLGDNIPVDIARELDLKIDDRRPLTGALRFTGTTTFSHRGVSEADDAVHDQRDHQRVRHRRRRAALQPRLPLLSPRGPPSARAAWRGGPTRRQARTLGLGMGRGVPPRSEIDYNCHEETNR